MKSAIVIQGPPRSGKSSLAKEIAKRQSEWIIIIKPSVFNFSEIYSDFATVIVDEVLQSDIAGIVKAFRENPLCKQKHLIITTQAIFAEGISDDVFYIICRR